MRTVWSVSVLVHTLSERRPSEHFSAYLTLTSSFEFRKMSGCHIQTKDNLVKIVLTICKRTRKPDILRDVAES
jgi:hypothetical protein